MSEPSGAIRLHVVPAHGEPFEQALEGEELVIGRSTAADLVLADRFLSRKHARLFRKDGELWVEDLGSHNGTFVNDRRVEKPTRVKAGDVIKLSGSVVALRDASRQSGRSQQQTDPTPSSELTVFRKASDLLKRESTWEVEAMRSEESLRRYAERLNILNEVHHALSKSISLEELLELILDRAFDHLGPEEGAIFLRRPDGKVMRAATRSLAGGEEYLYSTSLTREVIDKGVAALVLDARTDERFAGAKSIMSLGVRSLVAAPLMDSEGVLGMIALNSKAAVRQFTEEDMELLTSLASVAALRIRNVALAEEAAQRRRLEEELTLARHIQVALLPSDLPQVEGYEIHGGNIPSRGVSGDYYEVFTRTEGSELVVMVADVSGKGLGASLLTAAVEALSAAPLEDGLPPQEVCIKIARLLHRRTPPEKYATAFLAVLEPASGTLRFTNAGHNPALLLRASGGIERLEATGVPLGLLPGASYEQGETALEPGDLLVAYTDGITEAINPSEEEYGEERLAELCREHIASPLDELSAALETDLRRFADGVPFADDRTAVLIRRQAGS